MGLIDKIKQDVIKSGRSRGKFTYIKEGEKVRVRFLQDLEEGKEIVFHDSFALSVNVPCQEEFGRECPYCEDEQLRTRSMYAWSVYNYEAKEVQIFLFAVNNCSPVPPLVAMYENYGTLTDRDYVIGVTGRQKDKTYQVVPMDKVKFRGDKIKPFSDKALLQNLDMAYPADQVTEGAEAKVRAATAKKPATEAGTEAEAEQDDATDYSDMSPKELYTLCKERGLEAEPKKNVTYYAMILEEADNAEDDWGDGEDDDEWEDE